MNAARVGHARRRQRSFVAAGLMAALLMAGGGVALAQIGRTPADLQGLLNLRMSPFLRDGREAWSAQSPSGLVMELQVRGRALHSLHGELTAEPGAIAALAEVVAAATGLGPDVQAPLVAFMEQNLPGLAGLGPRTVTIDAYQLELNVRGEPPFELSWRLSLQEVEAASFPPVRHAIGPQNARFVIREFADLQCPFCASFALQTLPALRAQLLSRGDVRFEYHHFPLVSIHANAFVAAEVSECVVDANLLRAEAFWTYTHALFERQRTWADMPDPVPYLILLIGQVGLVADGVEACLEEARHRETVGIAIEVARELRLSGTPTVFVGPYRLRDHADLDAYREAMELIDVFWEAP